MIAGVRTNSAQFFREIDAALAGFEVTIQLVQRGLAIETFGQILVENPQSTGNAVANWNFGIGAVIDDTDSYFRDVAATMSPKERRAARKIKGDREAIDRALDRNAGNDAITAKFQTIYITNSVLGDGDIEYIDKLEENPNNFLRKDNRPGAMVAGAVGYVNSTYGLLNAADVAYLSKLKLSDI